MKTSFSRRELYAFGEALGDSATRQVAGRRIYGGGGGASSISTSAFSPTQTSNPSVNPSVSPLSQNDAQQGVAGYAQPYVNTMLGATMQNLFNYDQSGNATGLQQYNPYSYNPSDYVAGFSPLQQQAQQGVSNLQNPYQAQQATGYANQAIQGLLGQQYNPQTGGYQSVGASQFQAPNQLQAQNVSAERVNAPQLQALSMNAAGNVGTQSFTQPGAAGQYMSPYMQNVVDTQTREAQRQADIASTKRGAQAAGAGAFGGSRMAIENAEAARNLATQKGDIQATGSQAAYNNAQQQFNAEQQARLQANLANQGVQQQANLQNLSAGLQTQGLGAQTGLQAQQANQQTGLQALLANQQAGLQAGQANQNMQYNTGLQNAQLSQQANLANQSASQQAQQLAAQQQQFGANYGLQGLQGALSGATALGNLGTSNLNNQLGILNAQQAAGLTQQQQQQNIINQGVQNYQTAQQYPMTQLTQMKNILSGLPITTTSTQNYQAAPSNLSNLVGLGLGGAGIAQLLGGGSSGTTGGGNALSGLLNQGASAIGGGLSSAATGIGNWWNGLNFAEGGKINSQTNGSGLSDLGIYNAMNK
jgi:hypothetical protein